MEPSVEDVAVGDDPRPRARIVEAPRIGYLARNEIAPGVSIRQLWAAGRSNAGLLSMEPGAELPEHVHKGHAHHVWTVSGVVETLDHWLPPGSYVYVPPGEPHGLSAGSEGASLFYLYLETTGSPR